VSHLLVPLVDQTRWHVEAATSIHADDNPLRVLAPGMSKTKRLWTHVRDDCPAGQDAPPAYNLLRWNLAAELAS